MPEIARFYGLVIRMYYIQSDHNPPHVHVKKAEKAAAVSIETGEIIDGELSPSDIEHVHEWINLHKDELMDMWNTQVIKHLPPLD